MRSLLNSDQYEFKLDSDFDQVIDRCASIPRQGQNGTWITEHMKDSYKALHRIGMAHSAEVWRRNELVGGLYGVSIGGMFFGESMFSDEPNTSKLALIKLCKWLDKKGVEVIDCQIYSSHLESMGAELISRIDFLTMLKTVIKKPSLQGIWRTA